MSSIGRLLLFFIASHVVVHSCPNGELADKIMLHFRPEYPKGIPGVDVQEPTEIAPSLSFGPMTILNPQVYGLSDMVIHNFSVHAHTFNGTLSVTFPNLDVYASYQIPGLWWTTEGNFSVHLSELSANTLLQIAVLDDSCLYITDFQSNITNKNFSYALDGSDDEFGLMGLFFDDFVEILVNITKPTILEKVNMLVRYSLTSFLPTDVPITSELNYPIVEFNETAYDTPPRIPSLVEQTRALVRLVKYQVPWIFGKPTKLEGSTLDLMVTELHNMSVHNLDQVTKVEKLSIEYDGFEFKLSTKMYHADVYNRHRVLWFPNTLFKRWQWTQAEMGLVKHTATLRLHRKMYRAPQLTEFRVRPVIFNPHSRTPLIRGLDRASRQFLDSVSSPVGDVMLAYLYQPLLQALNNYLTSVNPRQLVKEFVCFSTATG